MSTLVLRLSAPVQSWAGYRASYRSVATFPTPTKSGIAGLLGACVGITDYMSLIPLFDLWVRADKINPFSSDFQVSSATKTAEHKSFSRAISLATAKNTKAPTFLDGKAGRLSDRDFLPHSEFMCAIEGESDLVESWLHACKSPMFMPYLGRRGNAPSFPFLLGVTEESARNILEVLPRVPRHDEKELKKTRLHHVIGTYEYHETETFSIDAPAESREEQLAWASKNLRRAS